MYQANIRRAMKEYAKDYFEDEERKPIKFIYPNDIGGDGYMSNKDISPQESIKKYIRVIFFTENNKQIVCDREDKYTTTVDRGYEDLDLREDSTKINLYQTSEYIELWNDKTYKVVRRIFMPCCPVCLHLVLKEV